MMECAFGPTPFGHAFIVAGMEGIAGLWFVDRPAAGFKEFTKRFPEDPLPEETWTARRLLLDVFTIEPSRLTLDYVFSGTYFQRDVWNGLLAIPFGETWSYEQLARHIDQPTAVRAVGSAVGANPIAWLIPCHRVVRKDGAVGNYRWGVTRKSRMLRWEQRRLSLRNAT